MRLAVCMVAFLALPVHALTATAPRRVAVVTGATRGIGRGIALELGTQGYTVYALGRSTRAAPTTDRSVAAGLDLTVESAAEAITTAGGVGVAIPCDMNSDQEIAAAMAKVSEAEGGKLRGGNRPPPPPGPT